MTKKMKMIMGAILLVCCCAALLLVMNGKSKTKIEKTGEHELLVTHPDGGSVRVFTHPARGE